MINSPIPLNLYDQLLDYRMHSISQYKINCNSGVMVTMLISSAVDGRFKPQSVQIKDYKIVFCCFSTKHAILRSESKYWLAQNQYNVLEWSNMSIFTDCCFSELVLLKSNYTCLSNSKQTSAFEKLLIWG